MASSYDLGSIEFPAAQLIRSRSVSSPTRSPTESNLNGGFVFGLALRLMVSVLDFGRVLVITSTR
jgi:hypothetical protein